MSTTAMTEDEYLEGTESYDGVCLACGDIQYSGVEPDAEGYKCSACGAMKVMGFEQAMLCGHIQIVGELE